MRTKLRKVLTSDFQVKNDILFSMERFYIESSSSLKERLLKEFHETLTGGHKGFFELIHTCLLMSNG